MDTVGWERAHFLGVSEGAAMAQLFAADFPERVESLALVNTFVSPQYRHRYLDYVQDGDAPLLGVDGIVERFMHIASLWSEDPRPMVEWEMPSAIRNESFIRWVGRLQRMSCSPKDFVKQLESVVALDAGDAPERITTRTLVMHVKGDRVLPVAGGRLLAELIPDAQYVEVRGEDHFAWIMPSWRELDDVLIEFATGTAVPRTSTRRFATVLFTDIVGSTRQSAERGDAAWRAILDSHDRIARGLIDEHGGRVVKSTGDGLLVTFDAPSQGVACSVSLRDTLAGIGVEIRAGVHAGEIELHDDGDVSGIAVNLAGTRGTASGRWRDLGIVDGAGPDAWWEHCVQRRGRARTQRHRWIVATVRDRRLVADDANVERRAIEALERPDSTPSPIAPERPDNGGPPPRPPGARRPRIANAPLPAYLGHPAALFWGARSGAVRDFSGRGRVAILRARL